VLSGPTTQRDAVVLVQISLERDPGLRTNAVYLLARPSVTISVPALRVGDFSRRPLSGRHRTSPPSSTTTPQRLDVQAGWFGYRSISAVESACRWCACGLLACTPVGPPL
jgi:hypothetical protein